jgi:hypothetical protein
MYRLHLEQVVERTSFQGEQVALHLSADDARAIGDAPRNCHLCSPRGLALAEGTDKFYAVL